MNLKVAAVMMAEGLALSTKTAKQLTSGNIHFWGPRLYPCDHGNAKYMALGSVDL